MVVGANLKVHTEYISVLVPPASKEYEPLESGYNSPTSTSCSEILPKIKRPITAQQDKHGEKKSIFPVNSDYSTTVQHNLQQRQKKQQKHALRQVNHTPITTYRRLKAANSLISADMMVTKEFKSNQTNISSDHSPCLLTPSKYQKEVANYSDDWESDYSDDWISDCADNWEPASKETSKPTKVPMQKESISDLKTDLKEATKPRNVSTQKESTSDLKTDLKEPLTFTNVREQPQFETDSSNNNIRLVPSDPNAFEPAFCQQRQAAINNMAYRTAVHSWKARSINDVVKLILELSFGKSLIDRAWIVFYWISQNIEYDIESYFSGNIRHQSTEDVFNNRKGVCDAFGTIFEALCNGVQLECKKISGYAKGLSFKLEKSAFNRTNHAWNVVRIDGHWYLVDPTWGEGYIDNKNQNVKKLNPFYFLVRPEQMIYRHLPENSQWQLLKTPVSMGEFVRLPYVYSHYFELGLHLVYPCRSNMASFNSNKELAEVRLRAPQDIDCMASIQDARYKENKANCLVHYDIDRQLWQCLFAPQRDGFHTLTIFARRVTQMATRNINNEKSYSCVAHFGLQVPDGFNGRKTFPTTYSTFSEHKCQIMGPFDGSLKAGSKVTIQCRIPGAYCARLLLDGNWLSEDILKNDMFKREFIVPKREVVIYVQFSDKKNRSSYDGLYRYSVH